MRAAVRQDLVRFELAFAAARAAGELAVREAADKRDEDARERAEASRAGKLGPELYGTIADPRAKWSCGRCGQRNDTSLGAPLERRERVQCGRCHASSVLLLTPAAA